MAHDTFRAGDITAVIGDNAAHESHRAGYNGLWSLTHRREQANLFVPAVAGLNFEHILDGDRFDRDGSRTIFFEPRNAPMRFRRISETQAELHQPPTPTFHLESWTLFTLRPPHYVDMAFRCRATQHSFANGYIGLFWASYIHAPADKSMYFRGQGLWQQLCTQRHPRPQLAPVAAACRREPCGGHRHQLGWIPDVHRRRPGRSFQGGGSRLRLTHSPSGGGADRVLQTTNPAWDFQFIIPRYEVNREYAFRVRLAYRPRCTRDEVLREVADWRRSLRNGGGNR